MHRYHMFTLLPKQRVPLPLREGGGTVGHEWSVEGSSFATQRSENPLDAFQCLLISRLRRRRECVLFQVRSQCWHPARSTIIIIITHNGSLCLLSARAGRRVAGISRCQNVERAEIAGS